MQSPTQQILVQRYPEGSIVSRKTIQNEYVLLSKSTARFVKTVTGGKNQRRSVRGSRVNKASKFFKQQVKNGFWIDADDTTRT